MPVASATSPPVDRPSRGRFRRASWTGAVSGLDRGAGGEFQRRQRTLALCGALAAGLAVEAESLQARDLPLAFHARGMHGGQSLDQFGDAVAQLQRKMGRGGAHQLAHVLDGHLVGARLSLDTAGILGLAQCCPYSTWETDDSSEVWLRELISKSVSISAWITAETASSSPISQP